MTASLKRSPATPFQAFGLTAVAASTAQCKKMLADKKPPREEASRGGSLS